MGLAALRNLDIFPIEHEGQQMICLRDPEGYVLEQAVLSPAAFFVAACLDGANDIAAIQQAFARQFRGALVRPEEIQSVVNYLEEHGFLYSERFLGLRQAVEARFISEPVRAAWLAGQSYPDDPVELRAFLDEMSRGVGESPASAPVGCIISPHIDFDRGGPAYAAAYHTLRTVAPPPATAIIFGVAHHGGEAPFTLTRKDFDTPLGTVRTDAVVVERLAAACTGFNPFAGEILHRTEHSIEFQVVMLRHLLGESVTIVPVLCGGLFEPGAEGLVVPAPETDAFLDCCRDIVRERKPGIVVVAGADLAHVGRRFGDDFEITEAITNHIAERDQADLACACAAQPAAFHASIMSDANARRVCGHGCIYAALRAVEGSVTPGEVFHYLCAPDPVGGVVTCAAVRLPFTQ